MTAHEVMEKTGNILEKVKTAVLATCDKNGKPHMRWMSPCIFSPSGNAIYTLTSPQFNKTVHLKENPEVEWMVQTITLDTIITLRGKANIIENPSLKGEVMSKVGKNLHVFWKITGDETDYLVLETVIETAVYFTPMTGEKVSVSF